MKITIGKDFNVKLNVGTDFNLKKAGLATVSFGETARLSGLKKEIKADPKNEKLQTDLKFAQVENQKLRAEVKTALKNAGIDFQYGKIEGAFGKQEFKPLLEGEKYEKGGYTMNEQNLEKLADFVKTKTNVVQVETSYLGKIPKYKADPLYMAEVKKVRNANIYQSAVGAHYDSEKKQFLMSPDGLKKAFAVEKKDDKILFAAKDHNLDSIQEVFKAAGLSETGEIKNMPQKEMVSAMENGETVVLTQKYFFAGMKKEEYDKSFAETKMILNDINKERISALKENFKGASFDKEAKGFVITKEGNPDWKEKLENYKKADNEFCAQKTKELDVLKPENKIKNEINNFTSSFGSENKPQRPAGISI